MTQDNRESTNFPIELARRLADIKWPVQYDFLYYHQNIARVYVNDPTTRGLLIFHGTGMGKSILAASIAMDAIFPPETVTQPEGTGAGARFAQRRVIVLLAKSLAINMVDAVEQYIEARRARGGAAALGAFGAIAALPSDKRAEWIRKNFSFVTMNAANMLLQMARATFISEEEEDLLLDTKAADLQAHTTNLDNKLLIIDEAHNFFRAIINGSNNATGLYEAIMQARNLKLIFLTGTPIASHPFEMAVCFNMLAGKTILPIHFEDFAHLFISRNHTITNREKFQNRIFGLVSFVDYKSRPGIGAADILSSIVRANGTENIAPSAQVAREREKQSVEFPEEYPLEVIRVPMTIEQYDAYIMAREREKSEGVTHAAATGGDVSASVAQEPMEHNPDDDWGAIIDDGAANKSGGAKMKTIIKQRRVFVHETPALRKPKSVFSSSYRVHSRQMSNYCPPADIRKQLVLEKDEVPVANLLDSIGPIKSVKFSAILERLIAHRGQLGMIYSQFVGLGGLASLARFLDQNGYLGNYALISGEVAPEERARIIDRFCAPENKHGETCAVLLVSSTGAEGIDLKNVRHVHILEPYWNYGRIKQVKARAIRNQSHIDLPPEERNVKTYVYVAVPPASDAPEASGTPDEMTSDEELYAYARESQLLIDSFEAAVKEVSIECAVNHEAHERGAHCRICKPTGDALFSENIENDVLVSPDPCVPMTSRRVLAKKIKIGDSTFYYRAAEPGSIESRMYGYEVFLEDPRIRAWRKLVPSDSRYAAIMAAIVEKEGAK